MDDMASAISSILSNPQTMQQIMGLASQLGLGGAPGADAAPQPMAAPVYAPQPTAAPVYAPAPQPAAAPFFQSASPAQPAAVPAMGGGIPSLLGNLDIATISKIGQILGSLNTQDENVELLLALKPHFGERRQKKVDDAIRIMQLVKVLPLLKETGIFGNLLGGGED